MPWSFIGGYAKGLRALARTAGLGLTLAAIRTWRR